MNIKISLTDELAKFVDAQVASGRYASSSEVVQEALRLMERHDHAEIDKLGWLRMHGVKGSAAARRVKSILAN